MMNEDNLPMIRYVGMQCRITIFLLKMILKYNFMFRNTGVFVRRKCFGYNSMSHFVENATFMDLGELMMANYHTNF